MASLTTAFLALAFAGTSAGMLIFAAKWQEATQKILDERSVWLSEVKQLEHDKAHLIECEGHDFDTIMWYADHLCQARRDFRAMQDNNKALQDKLSAILCPRNDHVWRDGVCAKCGRMQDR